MRDRHTYNHGRITGAIPIPLDDLVSRAKSSLHTERQIYIYGENDEHTAKQPKYYENLGLLMYRNSKVVLAPGKPLVVLQKVLGLKN